MPSPNRNRPKKSPLPTIPAADTCNGILRSGAAHCTARAGWGTDHVGEGRCKLHGGRNPVKHGRYSTVKRESIRELIAHFATDPEPLSLLDDLLAMRATWQDFMDRCEANPLLNQAEGYKILEAVTRVVERIEKIRSENAISRPEFLRVQTEQGQYVERALDRHLKGLVDASVVVAILNEIRDGWLGIRVK